MDRLKMASATYPTMMAAESAEKEHMRMHTSRGTHGGRGVSGSTSIVMASFFFNIHAAGGALLQLVPGPGVLSIWLYDLTARGAGRATFGLTTPAAAAWFRRRCCRMKFLTNDMSGCCCRSCRGRKTTPLFVRITRVRRFSLFGCVFFGGWVVV